MGIVAIPGGTGQRGVQVFKDCLFLCGARNKRVFDFTGQHAFPVPRRHHNSAVAEVVAR